ncbi:MAG: PQQ-dependent sugar dehydrogenase [Desulfuromonas sp.]|nr:PQQ-dependent sugar dehydrogenase [Desulfuromonas sp.]
MHAIIRFFLWTLILTGGVFITLAIPSLPVASNLLWFLSTVLIGGAAALVAKNCGRGALLLAIPISVLSANAIVVQIWPPQVQVNIFRAFNEVAKHDANYRNLHQHLLPVERRQLEVPAALDCGWHAGKHELDLAKGISLELFAAGLIKPHSIVIDSSGVVFVSLPKVGQVVSLHDDDGDAIAERVVIFAAGLDRPSGLAFKDGVLCVATATKLFSLADDNNDYCADSQKLITDKLLAYPQRWAHALVLGVDNHLYVSLSGDYKSSSWQQAAVLRVLADGELQLFSTGLYNCRGLAVHPLSGSLWATDNSPETIDYFVHPDELNVLRAEGDYGWPSCYGNRLPDAKLGSVEICQTTVPAIMQLPANSIPSGLAFGAKLHGADYFKNMLYMSMTGLDSGKRQQGFRLMGVPLGSDGRILGWGIDLVSGWSVEGQPWGQPTDCAVGSDGCLYITDQLAGGVYRLSFAEQPLPRN